MRKLLNYLGYICAVFLLLGSCILLGLEVTNSVQNITISQSFKSAIIGGFVVFFITIVMSKIDYFINDRITIYKLWRVIEEIDVIATSHDVSCAECKEEVIRLTSQVRFILTPKMMENLHKKYGSKYAALNKRCINCIERKNGTCDGEYNIKLQNCKKDRI